MNELSQAEAAHLLALTKEADNAKRRLYPAIGGRVEVPLQSEDGHEKFLLNINRGRMLRVKVTYQTRARSVIVLARLDFGADHRNPDGTIIGSPHLHLYREGFGDKWALQLSAGSDKPSGLVLPAEPSDQMGWFDSFLAVCNIRGELGVGWRSGDLL